MAARRVYVSGHLDVADEEFAAHYAPALRLAIAEGAQIVVGDARGADAMAQAFCQAAGYANVVVYHMFEAPRHNLGGFATVGGFASDRARDEAMTAASHEDLAWVRPGREKSGTARNLARRRAR